MVSQPLLNKAVRVGELLDSPSLNSVINRLLDNHGWHLLFPNHWLVASFTLNNAYLAVTKLLYAFFTTVAIESKNWHYSNPMLLINEFVSEASDLSNSSSLSYTTVAPSVPRTEEMEKLLRMASRTAGTLS